MTLYRSADHECRECHFFTWWQDQHEKVYYCDSDEGVDVVPPLAGVAEGCPLPVAERKE